MKKILKNKRKIFLFFAMVFFCFVFRVSFFAIAEDADDIRKDINKVQDKLEAEQKELAKNESNLYVTQVQISNTAGLIDKTETEISKKEKEIESLKKRIDLNKKILASYAQEMYFSDQEVTWALNFGEKKFSEYFENFDQMMSVKEKILLVANEIKNDKHETETVKEELAEKKEEHEELLAIKQSQKKAIVADINETKLTIAELQAKQAKLRSALSKFLGEDFDMNDVIEAVKYADKKTGVRKEFLFAVLDKETDLGRFTGGCTYNKSKMGDTNLKYFKEICDDLGYNYKKMKVSCALSYGIGGAMGVAQFMPSTWMGYKDAIADKTGNDPADPWSLKDGIMGMALYLKNKGGDRKSGEHTAAAAYYCGSRLERTVCQNYANTVISWSKGYDDYF